MCFVVPRLAAQVVCRSLGYTDGVAMCCSALGRLDKSFRYTTLIRQVTTRCSQKDFVHYRPQTKLRKGNVFTSVCQEFCPQGGCTPHLLGRHPPRQTPPGRQPLGRHPPPGKSPPSRLLLQWTVRILLECILVVKYAS